MKITHESSKSNRHIGRPAKASREKWVLRLYVAGQNRRAVAAFDNLTQICEDELKGRYKIQVIDLLKNPMLARNDQILAVPTLVRALPRPVRNIIGDLSNTDRVLVGLDLREETQRPSRKGSRSDA